MTLRTSAEQTEALRRQAAAEDDRFEFVIEVATGVIPDLDKIAEQLRAWSYDS